MRVQKKGIALVLLCFIQSACQKKSNSSTPGNSEAFEQCLNKIEQSKLSWDQSLAVNYAKKDPKFFHFIEEQHKSVLLRGQEGKGVVLLFHGILTSPQALLKLAVEFNQRGITVLVPLIYGFGSTVGVANSSTVSAWQSSVDYHARALSPCFKTFSLVGFSLGGALSVDFTLHRYPELLKNKKVSRMNSLLLLSPAIRPAETFVGLKANSTLLFSDAVPFWLISKLKNDPDIQEMMKEPKKYNQYFPVYVGKRLHELADLLEETQLRFNAHNLPVSLDYSQADSATDWESTRGYLTDSFFDIRIFSFEKSQKVPHSLHLREASPIGDQIRRGLAGFIEHYTSQ